MIAIDKVALSACDTSASASLNAENSNVPMPSPCIGICRMNADTGWCEGCWRTLDEISAWGGLGAAAQREVLARVAQRRAARGQP